MKLHLLSAIFSLFFSFPCIAQELSFVNPNDGTECTQLFFKALQDKNVAALDKLLRYDFTTVNFNGNTISGDELKKAVEGGFLVVDSGMLSGTSTKRFNEVEVVSGQWDVRVRLSNNNFQGNISYLAVCVRAGGKWQLTSLQLTPAMP